jgi:hypothetical protein
MYKPKNFQLYELVSKAFFESDLSEYQKWMVFDDRILKAADFFREQYGPMVCNDWYWGGRNHDRGYREPNSKFGKPISQHKFGRALDLIPVKTSVDMIRSDIKNNRFVQILVSCIEDNVGWLHIDIRNSETLLVVNP